jgi:hypothetical protein
MCRGLNVTSPEHRSKAASMNGATGKVKRDPGEVRLLREVICPNCWTRFSPGEVLWISRHEDLLGDQRVVGDHEHQRFLPTRFNLDGEALDARGFACTDLACPHCHLPIPRDLLSLPTYFVSAFGSHFSGKSFYVSAMSHVLRQVLPYDFKIEFRDTDLENNRRLKGYETAVFDNAKPKISVPLRALVEKTQERGVATLYRKVQFGNQSVDYPIPFLFTVQPSSQHQANGKAETMGRVVCLYDNAGESFQPGHDVVDNPSTRHLGRSNLLFFLFDPTQDSRFLNRLRSVDPTRIPKEPVRREQESILQEAARRVRHFRGLAPTEKHNAPLIVVVTKFDCWSKLLPGRSQKEPWRAVRVSGNGSASSARDVTKLECSSIEDTSAAVRKLLLETCKEIVTAAESFVDDVTYVPVSSVGWSARPLDSEPGQFEIRPEEANPYWVAAPMIHGLWQSIPGLIEEVW